MLPGDTGKLLEVLDKAFPPRCSSPETSREADLFYAGKRALVEILMDRYTRSTE